ncbi:MAG: serine/threonine-protein kinase [Polyangia bacterium]
MVEVGSTVGNYQVLEKIGQGSMGAVYLAQHPSIGKRVALKVIRPDLAADEETVMRFFNEARAVTQIGHENIIDVKDFGQTPEGDSFIVMELLEGISLGELLRNEGALPAERAVHIAAQITDGLAAAHARGIVHRDLKPDNVFLVPRGTDRDYVKILDFGLAKLTGPGALASNTREGTVIGTPYYMAPEAAESASRVDSRADVYSLGCILFEMVTGQVPFAGDGLGQILVRHLSEVPLTPSVMRPGTPPWLDRVVLRALQKKPDHRYASMAAFGHALREPATWEAVLPPPVVSPSLPTMLKAAPLPVSAPPTLLKVAPRARPLASPPPRSNVGAALLIAAAILGVAGTLVFRLLTAHVVVQIASAPTGAVVRVDGEYAGVTPVTLSLKHRRGTARVTLSKEGWVTSSNDISLQRDSLLDLVLRAQVPVVPELVAPPVAPPVVARPVAVPPPISVAMPAAPATARHRKPAQPEFRKDGVLLAPSF